MDKNKTKHLYRKNTSYVFTLCIRIPNPWLACPYNLKNNVIVIRITIKQKKEYIFTLHIYTWKKLVVLSFLIDIHVGNYYYNMATLFYHYISDKKKISV